MGERGGENVICLIIYCEKFSRIASDIDRTALVALHAFTGFDQNSSFLKKGKKTCWNTMKKDEKYLHAFTDLGKVGI